ncbi:hypothetical protein [Geoglobus acetivorans]|uniref:hypothetical protein n=1 Tax=Geoglobus acetivorans TaxID=565033 RepID=UPI0011DC919C
MRGRIVCLACLIFLFMVSPTLAIDNFAIKLVDHVDGYGKFIERKIPYEKGETAKIYVQASDINHFRAYAVDFLVVVYDPDGYPVAGKVIRKSGLDWTNSIFTVFDINIPESWKTGEYRAVVYVFDVLNTTATEQEYKSFLERLINGSDASLFVYTEKRNDVDYLKKEIRFNVVDEVKSTVYLFDSNLKAAILPEGMNNTLQVSVFNAGNKKVSFYLRLLIDGEYFSKKKVELGPYESTRVEFSVPQLDIGDHKLEISAGWSKVAGLQVLPVYVQPYLFNKPLKIGKVGNGTLVLSANNYVLGSVGVSGMDNKARDFDFEKAYDMNRDNAAKMLTNVLAYLWKNGNYSDEMKVALYYKSDERAEKILPDLLEYIRQLNKAPVSYVGVVEDYELDKADIVFYVTDKPEMTAFSDYLKRGGKVVLDVTNYYFSDAGLKRKYGLREAPDLLTSFYDFSSINKTVSIRLKTELKLPPELKYSNLSVSDFIVDVGQPVKVSFDVKNEGGTGTAEIVVKINGIVAYNETVNIYQNEKKHVEFEYIPKQEGSYKVLLDDSSISKVFFAKNVTSASPTPTPAVENGENGRKDAGTVTILVGVLAVLIVLRFYLRR